MYRSIRRTKDVFCRRQRRTYRRVSAYGRRHNNVGRYASQHEAFRNVKRPSIRQRRNALSNAASRRRSRNRQGRNHAALYRHRLVETRNMYANVVPVSRSACGRSRIDGANRSGHLLQDNGDHQLHVVRAGRRVKKRTRRLPRRVRLRSVHYCCRSRRKRNRRQRRNMMALRATFTLRMTREMCICRRQGNASSRRRRGQGQIR